MSGATAALRVGARVVLVLFALALVLVGFVAAMMAVVTVMADCGPGYERCNPLEAHLAAAVTGLLVSSLGILLIRRLSR